MPGRYTQVKRAKNAERQLDIMRQRASGKSTADIAKGLSITRQRVDQIIKKTELEMFSEMREALNRFKVRAHERFELIFGMAMDGFERSRQNAVRNNTEIVRGVTVEGKPGQASKMKTSRVEEGQAGDTSFLMTAIAAQRAISELWSLNSPAKAIVTREETPWEGLDELSLVQAARREVEQAEAGLRVDPKYTQEDDEALEPSRERQTLVVVPDPDGNERDGGEE